MGCLECKASSNVRFAFRLCDGSNQPPVVEWQADYKLVWQRQPQTKTLRALKFAFLVTENSVFADYKLYSHVV
jgi:hypothetical protein